MKTVILLVLVGCFLAHSACAQSVACPATAAFNGCLSKRCIVVAKASGQQATVCDACGTGYQLLYQGTAQARCDCAPGYGVWVDGKYTDYICKPCPAGIDLAPGGTKLSAACLTCPEGKTVGMINEKQDCLCPAGSYRAFKARTGTGLKDVECKACTSLKEYTKEGNIQSRCSLCSTGKVAHKAHTGCVLPSDPDAAQLSSTDGAIKTVLDPTQTFGPSSSS